MTAYILVDTREPLEFTDKINFYNEKFKLKYVIKRKKLRTYDVIFVCDNGKIGMENKRIYTDDFVASIKDNRIKTQADDARNKQGWTSIFNFIGDPSVLHLNFELALMTIKAELMGMGIYTTESRTDTLAAKQFIELCKVMNQTKIIKIPMFAISVRETDSVLGRMLKQWIGIDSDGEILGSLYENFPDLMSPSDDLTIGLAFPDDLDEYTERVSLYLSNIIRKHKNKKEKNKPLKRITNLVKWHYGRSEIRPEDQELLHL